MKKTINLLTQSIQYSLALVSTNELLQSIELILAILCSLVILIPKIIEWVKKAKADGKITAEELKEGIGILSEGAKDIKEIVDNTKKGDENNEGLNKQH